MLLSRTSFCVYEVSWRCGPPQSMTSFGGCTEQELNDDLSKDRGWRPKSKMIPARPDELHCAFVSRLRCLALVTNCPLVWLLDLRFMSESEIRSWIAHPNARPVVSKNQIQRSRNWSRKMEGLRMSHRFHTAGVLSV